MGANRDSLFVWFVQPVRGVDPVTGDQFVADRHSVFAETVRQDRDETIFVTSDGEIAARWPTPQVERIIWSTATVNNPIVTSARIVTLGERKLKNPAAYDSWSADEEEHLLKLFDGGSTVSEMSKALGRSRGAINARLRRLGRG